MKERYFLGLVALVASLSVMAESKVGVIDIVKVIDQSPQMVQIKSDLKSQFADRQAALQKKQTALQSEMRKLDKEAAVLSKSDKTSLADKIAHQQHDLSKAQVNFQHDVLAARDSAFAKLVDKVKATITRTAKQRGYDLVLTKQSVAFISKESSNDLTAAVLDGLR